MRRRFLSGMRMIASSPSGCTETTCIRMTRLTSRQEAAGTQWRLGRRVVTGTGI